MDLSFEQLKSMVVFAAIVEQGNFSGASKSLNISRASVSYHIKKLEAQFEVKLFYRSTRSISLTDAGGRYYESCRIVVEQANRAQQTIENFKQEPEGKIKLSCPVGVGVALVTPMVSEFKNDYPKIEIELLLTDRVINLVSEGVDIGIRGAPEPMADSELQSVRLASFAMCLCASPEYIKTYSRPMSPAELEKHKWVLFTPSGKSFSLMQGASKYTVNMQGTMSTDHAHTRSKFVVDGHGLGRLPIYDAAPYLQSGKLEKVLSDFEMPKVDMYAVFPAGATSQRKLRLLLDHIKRGFAHLSENSLV